MSKETHKQKPPWQDYHEGHDSGFLTAFKSAGSHYHRHKGWWNSSLGVAILAGAMTVWPVPQLWSVLADKWKQGTSDHWKIIRLENTVSNIQQRLEPSDAVGQAHDSTNVMEVLKEHKGLVLTEHGYSANVSP